MAKIFPFRHSFSQISDKGVYNVAVIIQKKSRVYSGPFPFILFYYFSTEYNKFLSLLRHSSGSMCAKKLTYMPCTGLDIVLNSPLKVDRFLEKGHGLKCAKLHQTGVNILE